MHVDHNMHVIGCNMHVTCTLFRIGRRMIFCAYTQDGEGLVERHERLFEAKTYVPGEDTYAR